MAHKPDGVKEVNDMSFQSVLLTFSSYDKVVPHQIKFISILSVLRVSLFLFSFNTHLTLQELAFKKLTECKKIHAEILSIRCLNIGKLVNLIFFKFFISFLRELKHASIPPPPKKKNLASDFDWL